MSLADLPRLQLAPLPTPLQRAANLERALGPHTPRVYLKRDDLTGLAFGGNKVRKLEFLLGDALAREATVVLTEGAVQSNHARATAAAATVAGLRAVLVLDTRHGEAVTGNHLLDQLLGAEIHLVADPATRHARLRELTAALDASGERAYAIPTGGSVPLGAAGYVAAAHELERQLAAPGERPVALYVASSSGGTLAGLAVGARQAGSSYELRGVAVEPVTERVAADTAALANATAELLADPVTITPAAVTPVTGFAGAAYGVPTADGTEAIQLLARTEGILLDPVYSGKAMSALLAEVRAGRYAPDDSVVFVHTGGGPALFAADPCQLITAPPAP